MRLVKPSPGEAYDRLTILSLKIANAAEKQKADMVAVFTKEKTAISQYLSEQGYEVPGGLASTLSLINATLWDLEDAQRLRLSRFRNTPGDADLLAAIGENAVKVIELNDARAETVQKINHACGVNQPEKLYQVVEQQTSQVSGRYSA